MSGETRLSLFVGLDASKAKAEAIGLKAEVEKLSRAAREAGQGAGAGASGLSTLEKSLAATTRSGTAAAEVLAPISAVAEGLGQDLALAGRGATEAATALTAFQGATREVDAVISQADQGLREAAAATRVLDQALAGLNQEATQAGTAIDTAAAGAARLGGTLPGVIPQTTKLGVETGKAAQSAGMMAAQWNDVVMMTLAGQSPMQLAIQQGTQMTQAFGNAGAGGALRMLGAGFMSMLNPMNLAVIAAIGLGSALVQAFMEAGEAQATAEESLKGYAEGFTALEASISAAKGMQDEYAQAVRSGNVIILDALSKEAAARLALMELDKLELAEKARTADESVAIEEAAYLRSESLVKDRRAQIDRLKTKGAEGTYAGGYATAEEEASTLLPILQEETAEMEAQGRALARIRAERDLTKAQIEANTAAEQVARQMLSQIEDGTLAVTTGMSNATGQAQAFAAGLDRASGVLSGIAGKIAGLKLDRISAAAQLAALQTGQSPDSARIAGDVAAERAQLSPLLSAPTGAASFAREQLATLEADATQLAADRAAIAEILKSQTAGDTGGTGSGSAKAATNAMAALIAKYQEETEALRALDPIQKALAQNHEALAGATEAERDQLITLIAEKERLTAVQDKIQQIGQLGKSAFTGLATGALTFRSALGNVLDGLAQMAASSAWDLVWSGGGKTSGGGLGGLLGSILGGGSSGTKSKAGGGLGSVLNSIIGRADGGPINGQGGPREDNILIRASAGEYMVNAAATAANLPLVEAINAGAGPRQLAAILGAMTASVPAFADGGRVGGSVPSGWMRSSGALQASAAPASTGGELAVTVNVEGARGNAEIADMVERGVRAGIEAFSRAGLPVRIRQINADPRRMS